MKKSISFIAALILVFSLCACGGTTTKDTDRTGGAKRESDRNDSSGSVEAGLEDSASDTSSDENASDESPFENHTAEDSVTGGTITLGVYEQDNDPGNGKEAIEWEVVAVEGDMALVVSRFALDVKAYNVNDSDVTWETCTLREWLNGDFFDGAFTEEEKALVSESSVKADSNPTYGTPGGNDTVDKVFILSVSEYNTYYPADAKKGYAPTAYAEANGSFAYKSGCCIVWLRTPGKVPDSACWLFSTAGVEDMGKYVDTSDVAFCPAMWINYAEYQK